MPWKKIYSAYQAARREFDGGGRGLVSSVCMDEKFQSITELGGFTKSACSLHQGGEFLRLGGIGDGEVEESTGR